MPEIQLGWLPAYAIDALLRLVGMANSRDWIFKRQHHFACEAEATELVDQVLPANRLTSFVQAQAVELARLSAHALKATKACLWQLGNELNETNLHRNLSYYSDGGSSQNAVESMRAFIDKKSARFAD